MNPRAQVRAFARMSGIGIASSVGAGYQHDIYQRYAFLRHLVQALTPYVSRAGSPIRILDVGCGPVPLTRAFLGPGPEIVRADVERFDDPDITLIVPGARLPFEDGAFDLVQALDVLEHVEAGQRRALVHECHRVARGVVLFSHPTNGPEVRQAEAEFGRWARLISGQPVPFLEEHAKCGLPNGHEVASWAPAGWQAEVVENAPLAPWLVFNIVDFLYAFELGDGPEKQAFNRVVNQLTPHMQPGVPHYRDFVCSAASAALAARLRAVAQAQRQASPAPLVFAGACADAIVGLHQALRVRVNRALASAGVDDMPVSAIAGRLNSLLSGLGQKDVHIAGLQERADTLLGQLTALDVAVQEKSSELAVQQARADAAERQLSAVRSELAALSEEHQLRGALVERRAEHLAELEQRLAALQQEAAGVRGAIAERDSAVRARDEELLSLRAHATAVRRELEATRGSRTWWATAPLRAAGQKARAAKQQLTSILPRPLARRLRIATKRRRRPVHRRGGAVRW